LAISVMAAPFDPAARWPASGAAPTGGVSVATEPRRDVHRGPSRTHRLRLRGLTLCGQPHKRMPAGGRYVGGWRSRPAIQPRGRRSDRAQPLEMEIMRPHPPGNSSERHRQEQIQRGARTVRSGEGCPASNGWPSGCAAGTMGCMQHQVAVLCACACAQRARTDATKVQPEGSRHG